MVGSVRSAFEIFVGFFGLKTGILKAFTVRLPDHPERSRLMTSQRRTLS